ncbi:MAG: SDR family NAD(P)-dependent oxidoreductase [Gammaproteobacteria bacterium]|nr:SDR family NAD(P)-dependent oxidoreductase [Gammaproteobacteria bacterium]
MNSTTHRYALITGASSGIGAACAEQMAARGINLILLARRAENLYATATRLRNLYKIDVHPMAVDVTDYHAVQKMILNLPVDCQIIDILINNAGLAAGLDRFQQASMHDWEAMIDTNIKGLLYITRAVLPGMIERNNGHIVNIGSVAGHQSYIGGSVYSATKAAVTRISEGLRLDLNGSKGSKIRVTSIDPGMVESEFSLVRFKGDAERAKQVYQGMTPLKPEDVADAVMYSITRPAHVNIAEMILYPTDQASATVVHRS